jgi:hypothetical protein
LEVHVKKLIFIVCLFASSAAFATTAFWTGNKQQIQTATGQVKWNCEYRIAYTTRMILVWRIFPDSCPSEVDVEVEGE